MQNPTIRQLAVFLIFVSAFHLSAQKLPFQKISVNEGLPQSTVNRVFEDKDGYIWVASWGSISRFDGKQFRKYGSEVDAIRDILNSYTVDANRITAIFQDLKGHIWFCSKTRGILVFNGSTWKNTAERDFPKYIINDGFCDSSGRIWLATSIGLIMVEDTHWTHMALTDDLKDIPVNAILSDKADRLILGYEQNGVIVYEKDTVKTLNKSIQRITGLTTDLTGALWVTTFENGVFRYHENSWTHFNKDGIFYRGYTSDPCIDRNNTLWVKTAAGLCNYDGTDWSLLRNSEDVTTKNILHMMTDSNGLLWLCTHGDGLILLKNTLFEAYYYYHGLSNNTVNGLKRCIG